MEAFGYLSFVVAAVFYVRTWKYIRTLVVDVNRQSPELHFSTMFWAKKRFAAWHLHSRFYPSSAVRKQIVFNMGMTVFFMLPLVFYQARLLLQAHP